MFGTFIGALVLASSSVFLPSQTDFVANTATQAIVTAATAENLRLGTSTEQMVHTYAYLNHVPETQMLETLRCESRLNPNAKGDHGHSYGIAQIYLPAHKDITRAQALDPEWSIAWMAGQFAIHNEHLWSCWRQLYGV